MQGGEVGDAQRQMPVGARLMLVHEAVRRTVHRLEGETGVALICDGVRR